MLLDVFAVDSVIRLLECVDGCSGCVWSVVMDSVLLECVDGRSWMCLPESVEGSVVMDSVLLESVEGVLCWSVAKGIGFVFHKRKL